MPQSIPASFVGRVLAGRYLLEEVIGTGGMGAVYKARDEKTGTLLAIKVLHQLGNAADEFNQRFFDEALIIGQLFHPNIVQVIGFDRDEDGSPFLLMELLRGKDMYDVLQEREKLPLDKTLEIVRQVASALHAAHNLGVAHRDVKPSNIFLARQSNSDGTESEVVKVVDFGLSKELGAQQLKRTAPGTIVGTLEYVSPEGTHGESELVDFRSDQWALAVVTYRLLSGRLPFEGKNIPVLLTAIQKEQPAPLRSHVPDIPEHVVVAIERAMAKKKEDRFASVPDFVRALYGLPALSESLRGSAGRLRFSRMGVTDGSSAPAAAKPSPAQGGGSGDAAAEVSQPSVQIAAAQSLRRMVGIMAAVLAVMLVAMIVLAALLLKAQAGSPQKVSLSRAAGPLAQLAAAPSAPRG